MLKTFNYVAKLKKSILSLCFLILGLSMVGLHAACSIVEGGQELTEAQHRLMKALSAESGRLRGVTPVQEMCFSLASDKSEWVGGIAGYTLYGSLVIDMFWIDDAYRRKGYGRQLLGRFEDWGRSQGATFAKLSTMEWWNAVPFYEALGYKVIAIDEGYEKGAKQFTLKKLL